MAKEISTGFSLKDHLFNRKTVGYLSGRLAAANSDFDESSFTKAVMKKLLKLELKQRIIHITEVLEHHLAEDFSTAAMQIVDSLPSPLDPTKTDDDFGDFIFAPFGEFVVRNGLSKRHLKLSLRTLKELTKRFSMEFAIRPFIDQFTSETMAELTKWSKDRNYHVRRLVSESTRPSLPWSGKISIDPILPLPFLDRLHSDPTRYVTRSVANHLNDLSKIDKTVVFQALKRWRVEGKQNLNELNWMTRHSLRTLVKKGDPAAMKLLGFHPDPKIAINKLRLSPGKLKPGGTLEFDFEIAANRNERLVVDYVIAFVKANGSTAEKVFKLKQLDVQKGQSIVLEKKHKFRANATTFTLHPGQHNLTIQVNGKRHASCEFTLLPR